MITAMLMPMGIVGTNQIILIVLAVLLLFGAKRIPELMRGAGRGIKEFKDAMNGNDNVSGESKEKADDQKSKD